MTTTVLQTNERTRNCVSRWNRLPPHHYNVATMAMKPYLNQTIQLTLKIAAWILAIAFLTFLVTLMVTLLLAFTLP